MPIPPATPQDLQTGDTWKNWGENLSATPSRIFHARNVDDLVQIVAEAKQQGKKIRVAADGHSWASLVPTNDIMVFQSEMDAVFIDKSDPLRPLVTMEAGATVGDVMERMKAEGVALTSNVVLDSVQYGGLVATGCHGSGRKEKTLSDKVVSMDIVTGRIDPATGLPEVRTFSEAAGTPPDVMSAARLNLGLFGIIHKMTLQAEPGFNIRTEDVKMGMATAINQAAALVRDNDATDFFWFPFNDDIWLKTMNRSSRPLTNHPNVKAWRVFLNTVEAQFGAAGFKAIHGLPSFTPAFCKTAFAAVPERDEVESVIDALHYQGAINEIRMGNTEIAFAVDRDFGNFKQAWSLVVDRVSALAAQDKYPMNMAMNARFIKGSDTLIAPSSGNPQGRNDVTCYIEILSQSETPGWPEFEAEIGDEWMKLTNARPHWSKMFENIPNVISRTRAAYGPRIDQFKQIRADEGVDPDDTFMNPLLAQVFA